MADLSINLDPASPTAAEAAERARVLFGSYLRSVAGPVDDGMAVLDAQAAAESTSFLQGIEFADESSLRLAAERLAYMQAAWQFLSWRLVHDAVIYCHAARAEELPTAERELVQALVARMRGSAQYTLTEIIDNGWTLTSLESPA